MGLNLSELEAGLQNQFLELVASYINRMSADYAALRMTEIEDYLTDTWFVWKGGIDDSSVFYYRVQSPVLSIEFSYQGTGPLGESDYCPTYYPDAGSGPTRVHIQMVVRTPNGSDYGRALLAQV